MTAELSTDEIRASLRGYFQNRPGIAEVRRIRDSAPDGSGAAVAVESWPTVAQQLGLASMGAPEAWGGLGLPFPHLAAAAEECGATLHPGPARAALLVSWSLAGVDPDTVPPTVAAAVEGVLGGQVVPGVAAAEEPADLPLFTDGHVSGRAVAVTHGANAGLVVCLVRTPAGTAPALVSAGPETERIALATTDLSTPVADIVLQAAPAILVAKPGDPSGMTGHLTAARLLLAAEQVGGAEGCLAGMVEYATVREQFGQRIGEYQAIQHRCSRTVVAITAARALVQAGADALEVADQPRSTALGLLARAEAGDVFKDASSSLIQVSGGIGFTWEHDAHLYFRRARTSAAHGGTPERLRHEAVEAGCLDLLTAALA